MPAADFGREALLLLRGSLGVGAGWIGRDLYWSFWGVLQMAWSEPLTDAEGCPVWRLRLLTRLLDGFTGSPAQMSALESCLPHAALAGAVAGEGRQRTLELASAVDVHEGNLAAMVRLLAVVARAQAGDARLLLAYSKRLAAAGLIPVIDASARRAESPEAGTVRGCAAAARPSASSAPRDRRREIVPWVDALERRGLASATETPWGVTASFALGWPAETQCILDLRPDRGRPLLGPGITIGLWTPVRGGPLTALSWNGREIESGSRGPALGGWWAPPGGVLVHRAFFPTEVCQPDLIASVLDACMRRARESSAAADTRG